jgi:hypothetical protein
VRTSVDKTTGLKPVPGQPVVTDWFIDGTQSTSSAADSTAPPSDATPLAGTPTTATSPTPVQPTDTPVPTPKPLPPTPVPTLNPNYAVVPNLVGMSEADAQRTINQTGLMTTYVNYQSVNDVPDRSYFLSIPPGAVLSQLPQPGTAVPKGTKVFIAVRKQ